MATTTEIPTALAPTHTATATAPLPASVPTIPLPSPGGRTPTLLQTVTPTEDRRVATEALASWFGKLDLSPADAERAAGSILTYFDLVPRGLGVVLRDAAREIHGGGGSEGTHAVDLSSLGAAVLLAVHEAYAAELSRPSATSLIEPYLATRK